MKQWVSAITGGLLYMCTNAQTVHLSAKPFYNNAGAYSNHFTDAFSFMGNPAALGNALPFRAGVLMERKWMLDELNVYQASVSCPVGNGGLGIAFGQSGDVNYHEQSFNLAYGKKLGRIELGLLFGFESDQALGYKAAVFGSSGIGLRVHPSPQWVAGISFGFSVFGEKGKTNPERGASITNLGFGYEVNKQVLLALQVEKNAGPVKVIGSVFYNYDDHFSFSAGLNSDAGSPYFQAGWRKNNISIRLYTVYENILGFSPGLILLWQKKNKLREDP